MNFKLYPAACCLFALSYSAMAQDSGNPAFVSDRKGALIGFSANLTDFSAGIPEVGKLDMGLSLMYWKGLGRNLDLSVRVNGLFTDYAKPERQKSAVPTGELEGALHLRMLSDDHLFNPFVTAGVGAGRYSGSFAPYAPVGVGLQVNFFSESYLFLQGNYRLGLQDTKLGNSTFYTLGFAAPISYGKKKTPPPPPVPVDSDNDGTPDLTDECPNVPGLARFNGCPDKDGDGIPDKDDKCPDVAGTARYNGCPVPDTDKDGINDEEDQCPDVAGLAKYNGCPIPDSDGDGVNDEMDRCPSVPGTAANRGCPEVKEEVKKRLSFAATAIQFETGKATIKKQSYKMLDEIVGILNEYPDYMMTIDGHTDNVGKPDRNLELSRQRANAVKEYFTGKGVDAVRLEADGHGDTQPKVSNKTAKGRAQNRRVDMDLKLK